MATDIVKNIKINQEEIRRGETVLASAPIRFNISLTSRCNYHPRCVFCTQEPPSQAAFAQKDLLERYAPFIACSEKITDCSYGEPLLHPQFLDFARALTANGQRFGFSTNGWLLTERIVEPLLPLARQLDIHCSLNAATGVTYRHLTGRDFERVIGNLRYYVRRFTERNPNVDVPLELSFLVMRVNEDEVIPFLRLAQSLGIRKVNLRHLFDAPAPEVQSPFGYVFRYSSELLSLERYEHIGRLAKEVSADLKLDLVVHWDPGMSMLRRLSEPGVKYPCLFPWKFLYVQEGGLDVFTCCYSGPVGNLKNETLEQVWNNQILRSMRASLAAGQIPSFCLDNGSACPLVLHQRPLLLGASLRISDEGVMRASQGWHGLESLGGKPARWSTGEASVNLWRERQNWLCLEVLSIRPDIKTTPTEARVSVEGAESRTFSLEDHSWRIIRVPVTTGVGEHRPIKVTIQVQNPWRPSELIGSPDRRLLGIALAAAWLE